MGASFSRRQAQLFELLEVESDLNVVQSSLHKLGATMDDENLDALPFALRHDAQRRQQLRALLAARDAHGNTVLAVLLKNRNASGYNAEAWARTAVGLLRKISPDVPDHVAWLNVCGTATPLMMLVFRKLSGDAPQLALVAACLVYGCDATIVTAHGRTARSAHAEAFSHNKPDVIALLRSAEEVGGVVAVHQCLLHSPNRLVKCDEWLSVATLPPVAVVSSLASSERALAQCDAEVELQGRRAAVEGDEDNAVKRSVAEVTAYLAEVRERKPEPPAAPEVLAAAPAVKEFKSLVDAARERLVEVDATCTARESEALERARGVVQRMTALRDGASDAAAAACADELSEAEVKVAVVVADIEEAEQASGGAEAGRRSMEGDITHASDDGASDAADSHGGAAGGAGGADLDSEHGSVVGAADVHPVVEAVAVADAITASRARRVMARAGSVWRAVAHAAAASVAVDAAEEALRSHARLESDATEARGLLSALQASFANVTKQAGYAEEAVDADDDVQLRVAAQAEQLADLATRVEELEAGHDYEPDMAVALVRRLRQAQTDVNMLAAAVVARERHARAVAQPALLEVATRLSNVLAAPNRSLDESVGVIIGVAQRAVDHAGPACVLDESASPQDVWNAAKLLADAKRAVEAAAAKVGLDSSSPLHAAAETVIIADRYEIDAEDVPTQGRVNVVRFGVERGDDGAARKVCLKLMRERASWDREINVRDAMRADTAVQVLSAFVIEPGTDDWESVTALAQWQGSVADFKGAAEHSAVDGGDADPDEGAWYALVMEKGDACLEDFVSAGMEPAKLRVAFCDSARAVAHLHEAGWVHTDLKPQNFVRVGNTWKLIDLDSAVLAHSDGPPHLVSLPYAPPEFARWRVHGTPFKVTPAYDVWQLGLIGVALLLGDHVYNEHSLAALAQPTYSFRSVQLEEKRSEARDAVLLFNSMLKAKPGDRREMLSEVDDSGKFVSRGVLDAKFLGKGYTTSVLRRERALGRAEGALANTAELDRVVREIKDRAAEASLERRQLAAETREALLNAMDEGALELRRTIAKNQAAVEASSELTRSELRASRRAIDQLVSVCSEQLTNLIEEVERVSAGNKTVVDAVDALEAKVIDFKRVAGEVAARPDAGEDTLDRINSNLHALMANFRPVRRSIDRIATTVGDNSAMLTAIGDTQAALQRMTFGLLAGGGLPYQICVVPAELMTKYEKGWRAKISSVREWIAKRVDVQTVYATYVCDGVLVDPDTPCTNFDKPQWIRMHVEVPADVQGAVDMLDDSFVDEVGGWLYDDEEGAGDGDGGGGDGDGGDDEDAGEGDGDGGGDDDAENELPDRTGSSILERFAGRVVRLSGNAHASMSQAVRKYAVDERDVRPKLVPAARSHVPAPGDRERCKLLPGAACHICSAHEKSGSAEGLYFDLFAPPSDTRDEEEGGGEEARGGAGGGDESAAATEGARGAERRAATDRAKPARRKPSPTVVYEI